MTSGVVDGTTTPVHRRRRGPGSWSPATSGWPWRWSALIVVAAWLTRRRRVG